MELPTELRHVYRALLRAATYLPDSAARTYIHKHVVYRFRSVSHRMRHAAKENSQTSEDLVAKYHSAKHIASVRRDASVLQRAGLGCAPDLEKVMLLTYGRLGRRRRELMNELLQPDESSLPEDDAALEKLIMNTADPTTRYPPTSKFGIFLRSQMEQKPGGGSRSGAAGKYNIRSLAPKIPERNIWYRPTPRKLVANLKNKWWAKDILEKISPPLPTHEWNRLRDLATGAIPIEEPPAQRTRPDSSLRLEGVENDLRLLDYFTIPVDVQKDDLDDITVNEEGTSCWQTTAPVVKWAPTDGYKHSERQMRRMYAHIWKVTPTMLQDDVTKVWTVKWGTAISAFYAGRIAEAGLGEQELFEGASAVAKGNTKKLRGYKKGDEKAAIVGEGWTQGVVPA